MRGGDLARLALRNLREARLRNALTTVGIAVGAASLVAMLSVGVGLQHFARRRLARAGLFNSIVVTRKMNLRGYGRAYRFGKTAAGAPTRPLDQAARLQLEHLPGVLAVYPQVRFLSLVRYAGKSYTTLIAGVPPAARSGGSFSGLIGKYYSSPDAAQAILQMKFARVLNPHPRQLLGKTLTLRYAERQPLPARPGSGGAAGFAIIPKTQPLRIVGLAPRAPVFGLSGFFRGRVFLPQQLAEHLQIAQYSSLRDLVNGQGKGRNYGNLNVVTRGPGRVLPVEQAIKKMGFRAFSLMDATRRLRLVFALFDLLLGIFGSLALTVASLGIVNTLAMALLERRREIGILKALGAADGVVQRLFLAEAAVMGVVGGLAGVLLGQLLAALLNWGTNDYLARRHLPHVSIAQVPWWLGLGALAFALAVSLLAGWYPARRAARLDPVEALRYE